MGKPGRPKKGFEKPKPPQPEVLEVGYYSSGSEWITHLESVFGEPIQVMGENSVPPSANEGAVFYILRPGKQVNDIFSDAAITYFNIRRKIRGSQSFRVEIRMEEYGLPYEWVSDQITYFRIDKAKTSVSFFDSFDERDNPVFTLSSDGQTRPSLQSLSGQSSVR